MSNSKSLAQQVLIQLVDGYSPQRLADRYACSEIEAENAKSSAFDDNLSEEDYLRSILNLVDGYSASQLYYGNLESTFTYHQIEEILKNINETFS